MFLSEKSFDNQQWIDSLRRHYGVLPYKNPDTFSNTPFIVQSKFLEESKRLCQVLDYALNEIVRNYFSDQRIRKIYDLDDELESILRMSDKTPYQVGLIRPDFLIENKTGQIKICELGCRYPLNGWMLSYYLNIVSEEICLINKSKRQTVPHQRDFVDSVFESLNSDKRLFFVHDQEKGTDIYYLLDIFNEKGISVVSVTPQEFTFKNGEIITADEKEATQFVLEMDREELKMFKPEVIRCLIENGTSINDVRSLILVHDKRVLAVLYDEEIMADYLTISDHAFLKPFLIPTYSLNSRSIRKNIINAKENWVLKYNSGGRGIDMYVKNDCSADFWEEKIENDWKQNMAQKYVEQESFDLIVDNETQKINIVGMLLYYNKQSFGAGIFRGSTENVINVHGGRGLIFPCLVEASNE